MLSVPDGYRVFHVRTDTGEVTMPYQQYGRQRPRRSYPARVETGGSSWGAGLMFLVTLMFPVFLASQVGIIDFSNFPRSDNSGVGSGGNRGGGGGGGASGDGPAILAAALKYDNEPYVWAGGHPPTAFKPGRGLDCSGMVNVAVMNATGINENQVAESFRRSKHWTAIGKKDAGPGDIMFRLKSKHAGDRTDHVVIVESNPGDGKLVVFEARTSHDKRSEQIRKSYNQKYSRFDGALRFHR